MLDGTPRDATTTAAGRAEFAAVHAGAKVKASYAKLASEEFVVPDHGGVRVLLSTAPVAELPAPSSFAMADLARAAPGVAVVLVYSDGNPDDVRPLIDAKAGYRVVLDPPVGDQNIGAVTQARGTSLVPESYLVDRKGVVRYYVANTRDWSTPEAIACVRALAGT